MKAVILAAASFVFATSAFAQSFDFTRQEFVSKFNAALKADASPGVPIDSIKSCKSTGSDEYLCSFDDKAFQVSVQTMKKLNLANGRFDLKAHMLITEQNKKVSLVLIEGDRSDPSNLFNFVGHVGSAIRALDPKATDDGVQQVLATLNLMRGDDDPNIGHPIDDIQDYAAIRCNAKRSDESTSVACAFLPRF